MSGTARAARMDKLRFQAEFCPSGITLFTLHLEPIMLETAGGRLFGDDAEIKAGLQWSNLHVEGKQFWAWRTENLLNGCIEELNSSTLETHLRIETSTLISELITSNELGAFQLGQARASAESSSAMVPTEWFSRDSLM